MATETPQTPTAGAESGATQREAAATKRSTAAKKGARTRTTKTTRARTTAARKRTTTRARSTARTAERRSQTTLDRVGGVAEKAVLTYVGAALTARDSVVGTVEGLRGTYGTRAKAERQLRRFERRGTQARTALERELDRTRTRVERELRERREAPIARNVAATVDLGRAKAENALQTGALAGAQVVAKVTERVFA